MDVVRGSANDALEQAAGLLVGARRIVVFTGAGVSTDSGIPDFRSPGGLWTRYDPRELGFRRYVTDPATRRLAWRLRRDGWPG
jgi:NAD-dependent deacetylase